VYVTDGCAGVVGAHEIYFNAQARQLARTRLTGNFGSEVLRSMSTFKLAGLSREMIAPDFGTQIEAVMEEAPGRGQSPVTFAAFREIPWNLFGSMAAAKSQLTFRTPYLDNDLVALAYRAPASERQSPDSALRLVRDAHPRLAGIPTDRAVVADGSGLGYMLKRFHAELSFKLDYLHNEAPPPGLTRFRAPFAALDKVGLLGLHKYLPYRLWFQNELAEYVTGSLADATTSRLPFLNVDAVSRMAHDHVNKNRNCLREINAALTLATVDRLLLRGAGPGA
jgi:asparagine synthase (glutamine-hydrolysing)